MGEGMREQGQDVRFATIGSSAIAERFLDALAAIDGASYVAAYSRDIERACGFGARFGARLAFDSLDDLASCDEVDAVYVASPNALHAPQARLLASAGKHVLVEKSFASNEAEAEGVFAAAEAAGVVCLEAMRNLHTPGFRTIERLMPDVGEVSQATFRFGKITSRIRRLEAHERVSQFDPMLSEGALMDMGVYVVEPAVRLFGRPDAVAARALTRQVGWEVDRGCEAIDLSGAMLLAYGGAIVDLNYSKIADDLLPSQVAGRAGSISWAEMGAPGDVVLHRWNDRPMIYGSVAAGSREVIASETPKNDMACELGLFVSAVRGEEEALARVAEMREVTLGSLAVMDEARRQIGVRFPADGAC